MTLEVSRIGSISYTYYWVGILYTINKLVEWWVTPVYEVVYSIRDTFPLIVYQILLIRDTLIQDTASPDFLIFHSAL